jgi:hypothetical protein
MKTQHFQGVSVADERSRVCFLFDPKDGRIVHGHGVTALQSKSEIAPDQMEARARKHAQSFGKSTAGLKALHLPLKAVQGHSAFKVNETGDGVVPLRDAPAGRGRKPRS